MIIITVKVTVMILVTVRLSIVYSYSHMRCESKLYSNVCHILYVGRVACAVCVRVSNPKSGRESFIESALVHCVESKIMHHGAYR